MIRDIRSFFEQEEEDYYKLLRVGSFFSDNYIDYESNGDRKNTLEIKEYLDEIKPHLKNSKYLVHGKYNLQ